MTESFDMVPSDSNTTSILAGWGVPHIPADFEVGIGVRRVHDEVTRATEGVTAAANWYPELTAILARYVRDGSVQHVRAWADSSVWESIGEETSSDTIEAREYVESVRLAFARLIAVMDDVIEHRHLLERKKERQLK